MKKRLLSFLLAVCTAVSLLALPAGAAGVSRYSDVTDASTAATAEVLRLMGVMDGYQDGTFRANTQLNRAQFCKMATYAMHAQQKLGLYRTVTVFPDVKPSHWAAPYVNLASRTTVDGGSKESGSTAQTIIAGFPDGRFHPERPVTLGQAVTILLRILGYRDSEIGGVWPDSFLATASAIGLMTGLPTAGNAPLTRGQAATLFMNLLEAKTSSGGTLYTLSEEVELASVDGGTGMLKTLDGKLYPMENPVQETSLVGMRGRLVMDGEKVLTFLPDYGKGTGSAAGAVVLYENQSSAGLSSLAGNSSYQIYKNGSPATVGDLRKYDVATYYPATNSIIVTDTRVSVFYESCEPSPSAPTKLKVLNGTEFYVLPTAVESMKQFRPGDQMTLLLTADGRVAGAVEPGTSGARSNAMALVTSEGSVELFCGSGTMTIKAKPENELLGKVVRVSSVKRENVTLSEAVGGKRGDLNVLDKTLGGTRLASGVVLYENGRAISLSQLTSSVIPEEEIRFARTNWAGEVDLIVLDRLENVRYGRAVLTVTPVVGDEGQTGEKTSVTVEFNGGQVGPIETGYDVSDGDYVAYAVGERAGTGGKVSYYTTLVRLERIKNVNNSAWIGDRVVNVGGRSYTVPADVQCYNASTKEWVTLAQAKAYSEKLNLYVKNGVVGVVEVR